MPEWAQALGTAIPVTHFLRVVRGSLLKGVGLGDAWPSLSRWSSSCWWSARSP
jgi:ABC-2 type transport system permease protein